MTSEKLESPLAEQLDPETVLATRYHITIPQTVYADFLEARGILVGEPLGLYQPPSRWLRLKWELELLLGRVTDAWGVLIGKYEVADLADERAYDDD